MINYLTRDWLVSGSGAASGPSAADACLRTSWIPAAATTRADDDGGPDESSAAAAAPRTAAAAAALPAATPDGTSGLPGRAKDLATSSPDLHGTTRFFTMTL